MLDIVRNLKRGVNSFILKKDVKVNLSFTKFVQKDINRNANIPVVVTLVNLKQILQNIRKTSIALKMKVQKV